ncbi:MAG: hypothetical protein J0G94_10615, partial [Sphingomonadales bacterium]|nr:hypothetical protein [Sphingomonadales bacterium]
MKIGSLLAVGFATALLSGTASASITSYEGVDDGAPVGGTFTNSNAASAAFAAAAGPLETIDFESVPTGHQPSYVLPGVTISVTGPVYGYPFSGVIAGTVGNVYGFDIGTGRGNWLGFPDGTATFTFDNPVTAFGFYTTGLQTTFGLSFDVTFNDGTAQSLSPTVLVNGGASFFGFTNTNAFSS